MPRFQPGCSGNPSGRARGSLNRVGSARKVLTDMLEKDGPKLMRAAIKQAEAGESALMVALLARLVPALKPVQIITGAPLEPDATNTENRSAIIEAMRDGELSIEDGSALMGALKIGEGAGGVLNIQIILDGEMPAAPTLVIENVENDPPRAAGQLPAYALSDDDGAEEARP